MKTILRALPALLVATSLMSCATTTVEEERSAYGAFLAARYAGVNRDAQGAADYYIEALGRLPGNAVLTDRAFITSVIAGDLDRASDLAVEATLTGDPSRLATLYHVSDLISRRRYREALDVLDGAPEYGPYNAFFSGLLEQWALVGAGRAEEALEAVDEMRAPGFLASHLWLHKGMLFEAAGQPEAAEASYRSAVFTSTMPRLATELYGAFLIRAGRRADALALYDSYLENDPREPSIVALREQAGRNTYPRRLSIPQLAARSVFGPTAELSAQADMDLTIVYLRMVQRLDPDLTPVHMVLAETLDRVGLHDLALAEYAGVPDGPFRLSAEIDRIVLMATLGQMEAAYAAARDLAERTGEPEAILLHADMARIHRDCGTAVGLYRQAIDLNRELGRTDDWRYHYFLASCLTLEGDWRSAEAAYLDALEIAPNQPTVLNDLGYLWIERGERTDEAFEMVSRAAEANPDNGSFVDSLGWGHYQLGHYELAVQELERAAALSPDSATINLHLGDAYWQTGRVLEAGFQWRRAADLETTPEEAEGIEYRLTHGRPPEAGPEIVQAAVGADEASEP